MKFHTHVVHRTGPSSRARNGIRPLCNDRALSIPAPGTHRQAHRTPVPSNSPRSDKLRRHSVRDPSKVPDKHLYTAIITKLDLILYYKKFKKFVRLT